MTTNRIQRTVRMCVLSTFLALVAFSFLAFGSASAHALTRSTHSAQTASTSTTVYVRIVVNQQGRSVFSPSAITVKSGTPVRITNRTLYNKIVFTNQGTFDLAPGAFLTLTPTQSQGARICGGGYLTITVV